MRRALLIFLSLVLALVAWTTICAEDNFYVIPAMKGNYAPVPKTGQMQFYATGDDGDLHKGVAWPTPRFTDNQNGTVTDNLTGLIWMKNASNVDADGFGAKTWADALTQPTVCITASMASRTAPRQETGACPTSVNCKAWSIMAILAPPCQRPTRSLG